MIPRRAEYAEVVLQGADNLHAMSQLLTDCIVECYEEGVEPKQDPAVKSIIAQLNVVLSNQATYNKEYFLVSTVSSALKMAEWVTNSTEQTIEIINSVFDIKETTNILDFGCGMGRIAKPLLEKYPGCKVIGTDTSASMKVVALEYVSSDRFGICYPHELQNVHTVFDYAIAIWALQHCYIPDHDLHLIHQTLKPDGKLFIMNEMKRFVPTKEHGMIDDKVDIRGMVDKYFITEQFEMISETQYGQLCRKR